MIGKAVRAEIVRLGGEPVASFAATGRTVETPAGPRRLPAVVEAFVSVVWPSGPTLRNEDHYKIQFYGTTTDSPYRDARAWFCVGTSDYHLWLVDLDDVGGHDFFVYVADHEGEEAPYGRGWRISQHLNTLRLDSADGDGTTQEEFLRACVRGDADGVQAALAQDAAGELLGTFEYGLNALHFAAGAPTSEVMRVLLKAGVCPNARSTDNDNATIAPKYLGSDVSFGWMIAGTTPLMLVVDQEFRRSEINDEAWLHQRLDMAAALLDRGADPNIVTDHGLTALIRAMAEFIPLLLRAGAKPYGTTKREDVLTRWVTGPRSMQGEEEGIAALLNNGVDPCRGRTDWGGTRKHPVICAVTALHVAAVRCSPDVFPALLSAASDINVANRAGITPLHMAAYAGPIENVALLIEAGADLGAKLTNPDKLRPKIGAKTALKLARCMNRKDVAGLLEESESAGGFIQPKPDPTEVT